MSQKTLIAIPSVLEWKALYKAAPTKTLEKPFSLNKSFDAACLGIGLVATAGNLTHLIATRKYSRVFLVGIAGALPHSGLASGDIVRVDEECVADEGYWKDNNFKPYFKRPHIIKATSAKLAPKSISALPGVRGISVNTLTASAQALECRAKFFGGKVEEMEGAAAFSVANALGVQVFEIRAISNFTGDLDESKWNLRESLKNLQQNVLKPMLEASK